jgi:hypothetical protein
MRPVRRLIIVAAELALLPLILACMVAGAWWGAQLAQIFADKVQHTGALRITAEFGQVVGALGGFIVSGILAAIVAALAQIERNTWEVARYHRERRRIEAAIDRATIQK